MRSAGWPAWLAALFIGLALLVGVATDVLGGGHRINVLAPPLLALVAWNLVVYVVLIVHALRRAGSGPGDGPVRRALVDWAARAGARAAQAAGPTSATLTTFLGTWASHARSLYAARAAVILHASAAALVLGALLSLYARGLVLEYRAGWDSTFLSPADVHAALATVLAPASSLSGIALPDTARVAAMRFSASAGENAAPWIHLFALTLALVVFLPRLVLAAVAAARGHRLATQFPLALDDAYFRRLRRDVSGQAAEVRVLPYSYHLSPAQREALQHVLEEHVASRVEMAVTDNLPLGAEDDLGRWIGTSTPGSTTLYVALFPLATTPEHEQHGALAGALVAAVGKDHVMALVDESGFRRRFEGETLVARLRERRQAWRSVLHEAAVEPLFADLDARESTAPSGVNASRPAHS